MNALLTGADQAAGTTHQDELDCISVQKVDYGKVSRPWSTKKSELE